MLLIMMSMVVDAGATSHSNRGEAESDTGISWWAADVCHSTIWSSQWLTEPQFSAVNWQRVLAASGRRSAAGLDFFRHSKSKVLIIYIAVVHSRGLLQDRFNNTPLDHWAHTRQLQAAPKLINPQKVPNYTAWWTEAHWCEQLAQGCCPTMQRQSGCMGVELTTCPSRVQHPNHYTTEPPQCSFLFVREIHDINEWIC